MCHLHFLTVFRVVPSRISTSRISSAEVRLSQEQQAYTTEAKILEAENERLSKLLQEVQEQRKTNLTMMQKRKMELEAQIKREMELRDAEMVCPMIINRQYVTSTG